MLAGGYKHANAYRKVFMCFFTPGMIFKKLFWGSGGNVSASLPQSAPVVRFGRSLTVRHVVAAISWHRRKYSFLVCIVAVPPTVRPTIHHATERHRAGPGAVVRFKKYIYTGGSRGPVQGPRQAIKNFVSVLGPAGLVRFKPCRVATPDGCRENTAQ